MKPEIAIVGGGPAGLAAAIALKRQIPDAQVTVLEKSNYDQFRPGETVPNRFGQLLQKLGLWEDFKAEDHWPARGKRILWSGKAHIENHLFEPEGSGWHLSRPAFDRWLIQVTQELDVTVHRQITGVRIQEKGNQWLLHFNGAQTAETSTADFLINATGSTGLLKKQQEINTINFDHLLATYFLGDRIAEETYTTIAAAPNGWWYHCNVRDQSVFTFFTDPEFLMENALNTARDFISELPEDQLLIQSFRTITSDSSPDWFNIIPHQSTATGSNWLAIGDAAIRYDPLSGQGIYKAFETAIWASFAIADHFKGDVQALPKYNRILTAMANAYRKHQAQFYGEVTAYRTGYWERRSSTVNKTAAYSSSVYLAD